MDSISAFIVFVSHFYPVSHVGTHVPVPLPSVNRGVSYSKIKNKFSLFDNKNNTSEKILYK
jgi:hypothetical protein